MRPRPSFRNPESRRTARLTPFASPCGCSAIITCTRKVTGCSRTARPLLQPWAGRRHGQRVLTDIAFTDHDRYHAGVDFDEIDRLREANPDLHDSARGSNSTTIPSRPKPGRDWVQPELGPARFRAGFRPLPGCRRDVRQRAGQEHQFADRDIDAIYEDYFRRVTRSGGKRSGGLSLAPRPDQDPWFSGPAAAVTELACGKRSISSRSAILPSSFRLPVGESRSAEQYPSREIILLAREIGVPFTVASDAHSSVQQGENYGTVVRADGRMRHQREICVYERHRRRPRATGFEHLLSNGPAAFYG